MLEMQDAMNRKVDEDWLDKNREWYRAVWIECAELMDHYGGWKWWKASSPDTEQVVLEIVDIWHFGLSMQITSKRDYLGIATRLCDEWHADTPSDGFLQDVETLAAAALVERRFAVVTIKHLLAQVLDDLIENGIEPTWSENCFRLVDGKGAMRADGKKVSHLHIRWLWPLRPSGDNYPPHR